MTAAGVRLADQGHFWVGIDVTAHAGQTLVGGGQLYVEYQIPEERTRATPVVLIHGGGGQGLDWGTTPDGRPGWRTLLVQQGYAVYTVDRPGHGRSPRTLAEMAAPVEVGLLPSAEVLGALFAGRDDPSHTQWPGTGEVDDSALLQLLASQRQPWFDLARDHALMRHGGAELLDRIGPAVIIASSAGGPAAWQLADVRPDLVRAVVALEPLGINGPFQMEWGISAAPLDVANLSATPIAIVTADCTPAHRDGADRATAEFLRAGGCRRVDHLVLPELGIRGNGHLMFLERNHDDVLRAVTDWIDGQLGAQAP